jgi:nucleotide-binding universal stress UspA family protein
MTRPGAERALPVGMSTIVVGVDFSPESEIAIAHAVQLARRLDVSVTLALSTYVPEPPEGLAFSMQATYARYAAVLKARLEEERAKLSALRERHEGQGPQISQMVIDGRPEIELPRLSKELGAVVTVVGTHGRTGFRRLALGSVAERIVREEARPVLVARGAAPSGGYRHIAVGLDFSPPSRKAVQSAVSYLAPGGQLDLIHCWQLPIWTFASGAPGLGESIAGLHGELLTSIHDTGKKWIEEVGPVDGTVAFRALERSPAAGLDAWATEQGCDLVVVGSHGYRGLERWLIGSVAEATVRHAPCSVVVVH